jgi:transmembrane sensor
MSTSLSHNDPDLLLARKIGRLLDDGLPLKEELQGEAVWLDSLLDMTARPAEPDSGLNWPEIRLQLPDTGLGSSDTIAAGQKNYSVTDTGLVSETDSESDPKTGPEIRPTTGPLPGSRSGQLAGRSSGKARRPINYRMRTATIRYAAAAVLIIVLLGGILHWLTSTIRPAIVESGSSIASFEAPDGSLITLRPHSSLTELTREDGLLAYAIEGEAYFEVVHNADRVFRVHAGNGIITVLGTRFTARNTDRESRVYLQNGSVRLTSALTGESRILEPGFEAGIGEDGTIAEPSALSPEEGTGWLYQQLNFVARPAERIFAELEHHFNIRIRYPDELAGETVTGRILLNDRQQALDDAGIALGGRFEIRNDEAYDFIID